MNEFRQNHGVARDWGRKSAPVRLVVAAILACHLIYVPGPASAETLAELIPELLQTHNLIKAAESDLAAAGERVGAALGGWYPNLNVRSSAGHQEMNKPGQGTDSSMAARQTDLTVTQLLWDFGKANSTVRSSELGREAARYGLAAAIQDLLLRAATAYINVVRANEIVMFSLESENNIKKQAEIENALVQRGAGLSSDVLNAKQRLSRAQSQRIENEGKLTQARNAYRAVFQRDVINMQNMPKPAAPVDDLPATVDDTVFVALRENPALKKAATDAAVTREAAVKAKADGFAPTINLVGEKKYKHDVDGVAGNETGTLGKVELNLPFNLGFTAVNTLKAAGETAVAAEKRVGETKDVTEQGARDAWSRFETARLRLDYLRNEVELSGEYLELARKERQLGTRTLNDVLGAETDAITALSNAASAEADLIIASFAVLASMGRLTPDHVMAVR